MSIDYSANAAYGLFVESEIIERMMTKFPQKTEMQDRFDERTGEKLGKVEVVTEDEHFAIVIGKKKFGDYAECNDSLLAGLEQVTQSINKKFSCFTCQEQDGTIYAYVFGIGINDTNSKTLVERIALVNKNNIRMLLALNKLLTRGTTFTVKPTVTAILEVC